MLGLCRASLNFISDALWLWTADYKPKQRKLFERTQHFFLLQNHMEEIHTDRPEDLSIVCFLIGDLGTAPFQKQF